MMKRISMMMVAMLAVAAGIVKADTAFTFVPASNYSCLTYCTGYFASDPADTVGYVNLQYAGVAGYTITTSVNGNVYQGTVPAIFDGGVLYNVNLNGTFITMTDVNYNYKHTCVRSGRGQTCHSWYFVTDGKVILP